MSSSAPGFRFPRAIVWGSVDQSGKFSFTKTYDGSGGQTHSIYYEGEVSGNLQSAQGTWCIDETYCGTFPSPQEERSALAR